MTRTALYRHFDASGCLLYVGITDCLSERDKQHRATAHWHNDVHSTTTEWCLSRDHALALERVAIQFEGPLHNKMHSMPVSENVEAASISGVWRFMSELADDLGVPYTTVASWKQRGRIPAKYDFQIIRAAKARGTEITLEQLAFGRAPTSASQYPFSPVVSVGAV
jgi:hypothetical protein